MKVLSKLLALPVHGYRLFVSPWLGRNCRFAPTCSEYALEALDKYGPVRGTVLTIRRVLKCRPGGGEGYDPVPEPRK